LAAEHHGVVTFHGLPVPGAVVNAVQGETRFSTSTQEDGSYLFRDLPDGNWKMEVHMTGFAQTSAEIAVMAGAPGKAWDLKLAPPPSNAVGGPSLPGGRSAPQLTPEQARARASAQSAAQDQAQARAAAVAATSAGAGGDAVLSGSVGAGGSGISVGNAVAGSKYNGNASFSLDNSVWDAVPYSLTGIQNPKAAYAKGRVGIAFGGPLRIPHLLSGKSGTFTVNYNMARTRNATTTTGTVPTPLERKGNFSQSSATVIDPTTGNPFPGNTIPGTLLNNTALALENYYPLPNAPNSRLNYETALLSISNTDNLNARLNETLSPKDRLSGGVGWQRSSGVNPSLLGFKDDSNSYGLNANASWSHTFNKRLIQNVSVNFSRSRNQLLPYFSTLNQNVAGLLGILGTSSLPQDWGPPSLSFTNFSPLSDGTSSLSRNQTAGGNYSINFIRAKHQWFFGTNYSRQQVNPFSDVNGRGSFTFSGTSPGLNGVSGYDFADFLLDLPDVASVRYGNADKYFRTWRFGVFGQDNWTISKAVTVNVGIRWDYTAPYTELYNRLANLNIGAGFSTASVIAAGQASGSHLPSSLIRGDLGGISPSLGLAWRPFSKNPKLPTTIRVSINHNHALDAYSAIANNLSGQPPFARVLNIASTLANPLSMQTALLNSPVTPNTYAVDPNYHTIVLEQAQFFVSQPLPKGYFSSAGVYYIRGSHLDQTSLPNSFAPGISVPAKGPLSGYIYEESNGKLQGIQEIFQFGRNMAKGLSASVYIVKAHGVDNGAIGAFGSSGNVAQNWLDLNAEKAASALLGRGNIFGNWQYSTGQGKAGGTLLKGWKGAAIKDWTFTNSFNWRAGSPVSATIAGRTAGGTGVTGTLRADATGLPLAAPAGSNEPFNLAAFAVPALGHWGTAGRNTIIGPSIWGLNASLGRVFRLGEKRSADLRFDATNFLNHVVTTGWGTVVNAPNYGLPTGTQSMRSMNANLRFRF
jgi:trimeric autotransporter adhesin